MNPFAILGLLFLFIADYVAIVYWLMRTANSPARTIRLSMRTLLIGMTVAAIHFGIFAAFLSNHLPP